MRMERGASSTQLRHKKFRESLPPNFYEVLGSRSVTYANSSRQFDAAPANRDTTTATQRIPRRNPFSTPES
jgi:hypothetical protein